MKNTNAIPDEEEEILPTRRSVRRRPPPDELPPDRKGNIDPGDIKARLDRMARRDRFCRPVDLTLIADAWAVEYVGQVFPQAEDDERCRLLLAAEGSFLAALEMSKNGLRHWGRLLEQAGAARDEFGIK